jgi:hypothetical protein
MLRSRPEHHAADYDNAPPVRRFCPGYHKTCPTHPALGAPVNRPNMATYRILTPTGSTEPGQIVIDFHA